MDAGKLNDNGPVRCHRSPAATCRTGLPKGWTRTPYSETKRRGNSKTFRGFQSMSTTTKDAVAHDETSRRDFLYIAAGAFGAVGAAATVWPFISQMSPSADVLAQKEIELDLAPIQLGQIITVKWQSKPVFIWHRTAKDIKEAGDVKVADLRDPQSDQQRVQKP